MIGNFDSGNLYFRSDLENEHHKKLYIKCFCGFCNIESAKSGKMQTICGTELFFKRFNCPDCGRDLIWVCDFTVKNPYDIILIDASDIESWAKVLIKYPKMVHAIPDEFKIDELVLMEKLL